MGLCWVLSDRFTHLWCDVYFLDLPLPRPDLVAAGVKNTAATPEGDGVCISRRVVASVILNSDRVLI